MTVVVKYGGNALAGATESDAMDQFAFDVVQLHTQGLQPVVVHGGGPQISQLMAERGKQPEFRNGLRVTDAETIDIVRTALMEQVNPQLVAALNAHAPVAIGVSGEDVIRASARDPELGFVGDVARVDAPVLSDLLASGSIPVVAPLGTDVAGQTYNINADTVAGAIAAALGAQRLVYLTDIEGLRRVVTDATSLIRETTADELDSMLANGSIADGMIPKVQSCIDAVRAGVESAHIIDGRLPHALQTLFSDALIGTVVR
ncbi:MAG: acetylglutamate kinase [Ilumatobacteraceae bacterium]